MAAILANSALIVLFLSFIVSGKADLFVTHSPDYVSFADTKSALELGQIPDVVMSLFGLTPTQDITWDGLKPGSMFQRPKANVLITVSGDDKIPLDFTQKYSVDMAQGSSLDVSSVSKALQNTFPESTVVDTRKNSEVTGLDSVPLKVLNTQEGIDRDFVMEVQQLIAMAKLNDQQVADSNPDLYVSHVEGYRHILNKYGQTSPQAEEARTILADAIKHLTKVFRQHYQDSVVVQVVTVPSEDLVFSSRKGRSLKAAVEDVSIASQLNLATDYDENYPIIFNIILWTMLTIAIALFGISYCMWNMDNGKDSIYMMTTPRLKKE